MRSHMRSVLVTGSVLVSALGGSTSPPVLAPFVSSASAADLDAASLIGSWSGRWETTPGGRGPIQLTFSKADGSNVIGTYHLVSEGMRGATPPFVGKEVVFAGTVSGNTITVTTVPPATMTVSGREMKGKIGTGVTFAATKK